MSRTTTHWLQRLRPWMTTTGHNGRVMRMTSSNDTYGGRGNILDAASIASVVDGWEYEVAKMLVATQEQEVGKGVGFPCIYLR